ncbi:Endonuclease/exonuclease/phosphatase [Fimicolochytrium jonesii]|uniref:Endonuclease/exonuclease/phosphatase n=1 Tax=Fimicolochytrium jonesii TaxID=1396493 RepID=UPI0022FF3F9C|nr:Endonuclease/exonuclease/phosphatase [Fimicolochytrium jonesii]KAI8815796.1 Endonuclease/exonuclease/phosphatase [Fimicolochytrium jonesii]
MEPQPTILKLLSWNINAAVEHRAERIAALCDIALQLDPDILCFQEVLSATHDHIQRYLAGDGYNDSGYERGRGLHTVVYVRKHIGADFQTTPLPGRMGRTCIIARCRGVGLTIASCHLESFRHNFERRVEQTRQIDAALQSEQRAVVCGDMNFILPEEAFPPPWRDVGPTEYTYDSLLNTSIRDGFRSRLDRLYVKGVGECDSRLVGSEPVDGMFVSDHFGIYAEIALGATDESIMGRAQ